jgi:hypothetical protein
VGPGRSIQGQSEKCLKNLGAAVTAGCRPAGIPPRKGKDPPGVSLTGLSHRRAETKLLSLTIAQQAEHRPVERSD